MYSNKNTDIKIEVEKMDIESLLGKKVEFVQNEQEKIKEVIENKTIVVTGGAGSIGAKLSEKLLEYNPKRLIILDFCESAIFYIGRKFKEKNVLIDYKTIICDVKDKNRVEEIFEKYKPEIIFHTAAYKHVPLMEENFIEAIKNNILGTNNVIELSQKYKVEKFILISTDKAVYPTNIMGATKRICEQMVCQKSKSEYTKYAVVRFGNVIETNGSIIPIFKRQIIEGGPVTITDCKMKRFFIGIEQAIRLILLSVSCMEGGEIYLQDMKEQINICDLATRMIRRVGLEPEKDIEIQTIGIRPGEKLTEKSYYEDEKLEKTPYNDIFVIHPFSERENLIKDNIYNIQNLVDNGYSKENVIKIKEIIHEMIPTYQERSEENN